jgi:hypothetical protein
VGDDDVPVAVRETLTAVNEQLGLGLAGVTFCGEGEALRLSGLGLPDLGECAGELVARVLDALWRLLDEPG